MIYHFPKYTMYGVFFAYMKTSQSIWVHEDASLFSPAFFLTICFCSKNLASVLGKAQCRKSPVVKSGFRWYTKRGNHHLSFCLLGFVCLMLGKKTIKYTNAVFPEMVVKMVVYQGRIRERFPHHFFKLAQFPHSFLHFFPAALPLGSSTFLPRQEPFSKGKRVTSWMIHLLYGGFYEHNLKQRHSISEIYNHSWWLQPIPQNYICLSNWIINPQGPGWNCKQLWNFTT